MLLVPRGLWEQAIFFRTGASRQARHLVAVIATAKSVIICLADMMIADQAGTTCPTCRHISGVGMATGRGNEGKTIASAFAKPKPVRIEAGASVQLRTRPVRYRMRGKIHFANSFKVEPSVRHPA